MASMRFRDWAELDTAERTQLSESSLEFARKLEPRLKAFVEFESGAGSPARGVLHAMPYAAKDIFVSATRLPHGGLAQPLPMERLPRATVLDLLDRAGARRIGYTTMTELAYEPSGYNATHGAPKNPWNFDFITGGSSSGSAVAVASGSTVFAFGSDTGGSLRIPAHCCGLTSWKPTFGAVPLAGAMPLSPSLDTVGILARSASDLRDPPASYSPHAKLSLSARSLSSGMSSIWPRPRLQMPAGTPSTQSLAAECRSAIVTASEP